MQQHSSHRNTKGEEKEQGIRNLFEKVITGNFPNLLRKVMQVQEEWKVPIKVNPRRLNPRHIIIKMTNIKDEERILKAAREKSK